MATMTSVNLPFPGFYDSWYSHEIDSQESMEVENHDERERDQSKELRVSGRDYAEILFRNTQYGDAYAAIARAYPEYFEDWAEKFLGFKLGLEFEEMTSPREYNFETDRIFVSMPIKSAAKLFAISHSDNHATLATVIRKRFTSYDGFISHYPNHLDAWLAKPLPKWDHNELCTLLLAALALKGADDERDYSIFNAMTDGAECFYNAWSNAVDWPKVEQAVADRRDEIQAELRAEDPDAESVIPRFFPHPDQLTFAFYR